MWLDKCYGSSEARPLHTFRITGFRDRRLAGHVLLAAQQICFDHRALVFQLASECFVVVLIAEKVWFQQMEYDGSIRHSYLRARTTNDLLIVSVSLLRLLSVVPRSKWTTRCPFGLPIRWAHEATVEERSSARNSPLGGSCVHGRYVKRHLELSIWSGLAENCLLSSGWIIT